MKYVFAGLSDECLLSQFKWLVATLLIYEFSNQRALIALMGSGHFPGSWRLSSGNLVVIPLNILMMTDGKLSLHSVGCTNNACSQYDVKFNYNATHYYDHMIPSGPDDRFL